jgi:hypothetical protein
MAKIPASSGGGLGALGEPPPAGTYLAVCVDVIDLYGVDRPKTKAGALHKIATREMKITSGPKANLTKFIKAWTGEVPKAGWDTEQLKGKGAQITVTAEESRNGKTYNNITGIAPVLEDYADKVPPVNAFANVGGQSAKSDDSEFEVLGPVKGGDPF